jgi:hypothetical protein
MLLSWAKCWGFEGKNKRHLKRQVWSASLRSALSFLSKNVLRALLLLLPKGDPAVATRLLGSNFLVLASYHPTAAWRHLPNFVFGKKKVEKKKVIDAREVPELGFACAGSLRLLTFADLPLCGGFQCE